MVRRFSMVLAGAAAVLAAGVAVAADATATDARVIDQGRAIAQRAIAYLWSRQDAATGAWASPTKEGAPVLPAISGLALTGILMDPSTDHNDPKVRSAAAYILSFAKPDGGIHDGVLENYNTSICVSALSGLKTEESRAVVKAAVPYLRGLQWGEDSSDVAGTGIVGRDHPYYGGVGYGSHGRPDNSNLNMMLTALQDAGVPGDDPAVQRALVFLQRTQMVDEVNDMPYADGSDQGGFIYATGPDKDHVGHGESKGGTVEESADDGTNVSRLRAYGSMTYAGFKSYLYADLEHDDPRVRAAMDWIRHNYTLEENPGVGTDGYYYYLCTFGRALDAAGVDAVEAQTVLTGQFLNLWRSISENPQEQPAFQPATPGAAVLPLGREVTALREGKFGFCEGSLVDGTRFTGRFDVNDFGYLITYEDHDWRADLIDKLATLQQADGSFKAVDDRWMEDNPVLITSYALIALEHALRETGPASGREGIEAPAEPAASHP